MRALPIALDYIFTFQIEHSFTVLQPIEHFLRAQGRFWHGTVSLVAAPKKQAASEKPRRGAIGCRWFRGIRICDHSRIYNDYLGEPMELREWPNENQSPRSIH